MKKPILIDVREWNEFDAIPPLPEALTMPMSRYDEWVEDLSKDENYLLICHTNNRSKRVAEWMNRDGFNAEYMNQGMSVLTGKEGCGPCQILKEKGVK